ncbi:MAG: hypothetical protein Q7R54_02720 [bacterium]|nr:hypothetical protein [bacterium]
MRKHCDGLLFSTEEGDGGIRRPDEFRVETHRALFRGGSSP